MMFTPARWLPSGHLMTVFGAVARLPRALPTWRERWELSDGDFVDVERLAAPHSAAPLLIVCHGLEGSSRAPYVQGVLREAMRCGFGAVAVNFRGCSGEMNRLQRFYHSGDTGDLAEVVARVASEGRPIGLVGFSLGGNVVAKYLGERRAPAAVRGGAVVSVPFDLASCAASIDGPGLANFVYRERFLRRLRNKVLAKAARQPGAFDVGATRRLKTFRDFDDKITAPLHGFDGAEDYWRKSSAGRFLPDVDRPLLILHAEDDPIVPIASLPLDAARQNRHLTIEIARAGGHVGFIAGPPWKPIYWAERRILEFLRSVLS